MKNTNQKGAAPIIIIVIILALTAGGYYFYSRNKAKVTEQPAPSNNQPLGGTQGDIRVETTYNVGMRGIAFSPKVISIKTGDRVVWTNDDNMNHNVVSNVGVFSSGNMTPGQTFSYSFGTAGTFEYTCTYHPGMTGVIIVTD